MRSLALALLLLCGCSGLPELDVLTDSDPERSGVDGSDGPLGAALYTGRALARVDDLVPYEVVVPLVDGDVPEGPLPVVVTVQGGFVGPQRYRWLGRHFATRGYVTVSAKHDANLALLSRGNSNAALDDVFADSLRAGHPLEDRLDLSAPAAVLGHSLGGVTAAALWADDPDRWGLLGILASFPAGDTDVEQFTDRPSVHLVGSEDEPEVKREEGFDRFAPPRLFGVVDGMNHYAWTDDATERELAGDSPALRPDDATRPDAFSVLDAALDGWLLGDPDALERLESGSFDGVEVAR